MTKSKFEGALSAIGIVSIVVWALVIGGWFIKFVDRANTDHAELQMVEREMGNLRSRIHFLEREVEAQEHIRISTIGGKKK